MPFSLIPGRVCRSVLDIAPKSLAASEVRGVILDLDNTLARYSESALPSDIAAWIRALQSEGISIAALSNNKSPERLRAIFKPLHIPHAAQAKKPSRKGFLVCSKDLGIPPTGLLVIGDQIFTDVLGGNRAGMKTILVTPRGLFDNPWFVLRRFFELPFILISKWRNRS